FRSRSRAIPSRSRLSPSASSDCVEFVSSITSRTRASAGGPHDTVEFRNRRAQLLSRFRATRGTHPRPDGSADAGSGAATEPHAPQRGGSDARAVVDGDDHRHRWPSRARTRDVSDSLRASSRNAALDARDSGAYAGFRAAGLPPFYRAFAAAGATSRNSGDAPADAG